MGAFFFSFFVGIICVIVFSIGIVIALAIGVEVSKNRLKMEMESTKNYIWYEILNGLNGGTAIAIDKDKLVLGLFYATKTIPHRVMNSSEIVSALFYSPKAHHKIVECKDILGVELVSDGEVITRVYKGSLGKALIGGALYGDTGAILGGLIDKREVRTERVSNFALKVIINDLENPEFFVELKGSGSDKGSWQYRTGKREGERWISLIKILMKTAERAEKNIHE
jgi:hypothetical protein